MIDYGLVLNTLILNYVKGVVLVKVAIMGAGLAGLSCAVLLEQYGIVPDIYEAQYKIGARFTNGEAIMNILDFPVEDCFSYLDRKYKVKLKPINTLESLVIHGPEDSALIEGELGYITSRGNHPCALEVQLGDISKAPVFTNNYYTIDDLKGKYDVVVVATGNSNEPKRQRIWETDIVANIIGASIRGTFNPHQAEVWLNDTYAPQGYCFLLPYHSNIASLCVAVPGTEGVNLELLWQKFLATLHFQFSIKDTFTLHSFQIGRNKSLVSQNLVFVGHAGGFVMPFLGFGQFTSMLSGFEAAIAIAGGNLQSYVEAMQPLIDSYYPSLKIRRLLASLDNNKYNLLVRILKNKYANTTFSKFPIPILKLAASVLDPFMARNADL